MSEEDKEIVERLFNLWDICEKEYKERYGEAINMDVLTLLFDRAHHEIISREIEKRRQETHVQQEDEPATEKQLAYIAKLGGDVLRNWTKREASKWIDEHRK